MDLKRSSVDDNHMMGGDAAVRRQRWCGRCDAGSQVDQYISALAVIDTLPASADDDSWPFLTRAMFSHTASPHYRDEIVHFAASYKDILGSWDDWAHKLEQILSQIEFEEATVLIEDCYRGELMARWLAPEGSDMTRTLCSIETRETDP